MWFDDLLICLECGGAMTRKGATLSCGLGHSIPAPGNAAVYSLGGSDDWARRQQESVERYQADEYEEDPTIGQMFGGFIAVSTSKDDVVLDIGCGLSAQAPHYVAQLNLVHFLGLEPLDTAVDREYPCLVGAVAENIPLKNQSVDAILFGTSLDHIEAEDAAIAEVLRVLKPDGRIYFWQGLWEAEMIPVAKDWRKIFAEGNRLKRAGRWLLAYAEYGFVSYRMWKRKRQLERGEPIDDIHFRYYTLATFHRALDRWKLRRTRELVPPGQSSVFVEAVRT
jgi:SAM-dependent methyltransferase